MSNLGSSSKSASQKPLSGSSGSAQNTHLHKSASLPLRANNPSKLSDPKLAELEKNILDWEEQLTKLENHLREISESAGSQLMEYSKKYKSNFEQFLTDIETKEKKLQAQVYDMQEKIFSLKKQWRDRFMNLLIREFRVELGRSRTKDNSFAESAKHSVLLKRFQEGNQQGRDFSEGFGDFELKASEIEAFPDKQLGSGAFGVVCKGLCRGKEVAVKILKGVQFDPKVLEEFKRECHIMRSIPHPNILLFLGACFEPGQYKLVTELAPNGSLDKILLKKDVKLSFLRKIKMAREVAQGLNCLHKHNPPLLHLDLKPANLLLMEDWTVKIADFGMSRLKKSVREPNQENEKAQPAIGGTPLYMPPEMFGTNPSPSEKCDVYAYGLILWEMITEKQPYEGKYKSLPNLIRAVCNNERPDVPPNTPASLAKMIKQCWDGKPDIRPTVDNILESNVFDSTIHEAIAEGENRVKEMWAKFGKTADGQIPEEVNWESFKKEFCLLMNVNEAKQVRELLALRALMDVDETKGKVTLVSFQNLIRWFKPLRPCGSGEQSTLDDIADLVKAKWFWGNLSANEAATKLSEKGAKSGTYMVRFSKQSGQFTITYVGKKDKNKSLSTINNVRLPLLKDGETLQAVVKHECKKLHLTNALENRPAKYAAIFAGKEVAAPHDESTNYLYCPGNEPTTNTGGIPGTTWGSSFQI